MKKLFALMLALMLTLAGVSAVSAEDAAPAASSGGSITLSMTLNEEAIAALAGASDETSAKLISSIVGLVNSLSITTTSDGVDAEMFVNVNDQSVAGLAVLKDTDKMFLLSDIFPNYILKIDQQAMAGASGESAGSIGMPQISLDPAQMAAMAEPITKLMNDIMGKVGEAEAVEEVGFDTVFTVKNPIKMTTKEALSMVLTAAKEIVAQEGFSSLIGQLKAQGMPISFSAEDIDKKIEELGNTKEEDLPVLNAAIYSNEAQDSMFVVEETKGEETVTVVTASIQGGFAMTIDVPGKLSYIMHVTAEGTMDMNMQFSPQEGVVIDIEGSFIGNEEGFIGAFDVKMNETELGTLSIAGAPNGVLSGSFKLEGKTEVSIADLADQTSEKYQGFMTDVMTGVMTAMTKITQVFPDFANIMQMMTPQTQAQPQK